MTTAKTTRQALRVSDEQLYWRLDAEQLPFHSTKDIKPNRQILGHQTAVDALRFAIECQSPGFNAYVRGVSGSGRKTLVKKVLDSIKPKARQQQDYCYVHNFKHPNVPRLIVLKGGYGGLFKQMMSSFSDYVANDLGKTFNNEGIRQQRLRIEAETNKAVEKLYQPFEAKLAKYQLALANVKEGQETRMIIAPVHEGKILSPEAVNALVEQGVLHVETLQTAQAALPELQKELLQISEQSNALIDENFASIAKINRQFVREQLRSHLDAISKKFAHQDIDDFLAEIVDDFIANHLYMENKKVDPTVFYGVNILSKPHVDDKAPIVFEQSPTLSSLLGSVESEGKLLPYQSISAGSLIKADGGFLVIAVDEALSESGVWSTLMRTLRSGKLSLAFEDKPNGQPAVITPDAIPLDVKVILIGSHQRFYELKAYDASFSDQFKVLVDLDTALKRQQDSYLQYGQIIRKVVDKENLLHFNRDAVAQIIEHGARLSATRNKLSARFGRVMDTVREASYLAAKTSASLVDRKHVVNAIRAKKKRSFAPAQHFYDLMESGTVMIQTDGEAIGQINGLAVTRAGDISYGFPARITATLAPGQSGLINIEGQADLSGQIHTKGFQILGGVLRHILKPEHPLSFSASIAFEQSYGGIDGDSASGAEACCLLSALTAVPIKQSLSMTGAIDQFGHIQAIGGVNEKIEGFYDACCFNELTGEQGVIIPQSNVADLMLRDDVVRSCEAGRFHIYAVEHVLDALAILTDTASCKVDLLQCRPYTEHSLLATAVERSGQLYEQSKMMRV